jgi:S1-C subfamily serine protease
VPSNEVKRLLPKLKEGEEIKRPFIGIAMAPITDEIAEQLDLPVKEGVLIQDVTEGTAASRAGLRAGEPNTDGVPEGGDVITAVDGEKVTEPSEVAAAVASKAVGDEVKLEVYRGDRKRTVTVTLGERPASAE